ncbi:uncharacterized protein LY89DRAFT_790492 [Mollisia scopiformis]|uniref:Uncharacterized protein n=1 Tax=Mollisia scopiformis TaxID=149040 RepID=A0A132B2C4_MOLSC|nr:uncharacterized protein LY89DRAFT_790492 [Mollisia scopiformis]KUJ06471.1 hypothetical protein LY89DRAFT_790492 [Mollisia scopiformis]
MDSNHTTAPQSSTLEIYKDAFAPQPRPRTRAWERSSVEARAPRLQGQKIWKKAAHKAPHDDKENFEAALVELEKGGAGMRKKQRIMGAKENINDAQWQLIQEGANVKVLLSPKKNGRQSLAAGNADALLVPRKRTNANHLITPRKPLRKVPNGIHPSTAPLELPAEPAIIISLSLETGTKPSETNHLNNEIVDDASRLPSPRTDNRTADTEHRTPEKPERRRKSLRKSTRRITQNEISEAMPSVPMNDNSSNSLSVVVWSAPAFKTFRATESISKIPNLSMEESISSPAEELVAQARVIELDQHISDERKVLSPTIVHKSLDGSLELDNDNASGNEHSEEPIDSPRHHPILKESSPALSQDSNLNNSTSSAKENTILTTSAADLESVTLESMENIAYNSTRAITPRSNKKTPQRGSRRSTRVSPIKSTTSSSQSAEMQAIVEARSLQQTASSSASHELDCLITEPENLTISQSSDSIPTELPDLQIARDLIAAYGNEDSIYGGCDPTEEENTCDSGVADSLPTSLEETSQTESDDSMEEGDVGNSNNLDSCFENPANETIEEVEQMPPTSVIQESHSHSQEIEFEHSNPNDEMDVDSTLMDMVIEDSELASPDVAQLATNMNQPLDLFPSVGKINTESSASELVREELVDETVEEHEVLELISLTTAEDRKSLEQEDSTEDVDATISTASTLALLEKNPSDSEPRPLVDHDDTDLLRDFVTRVKANKAAKAATGIPKRKRSLPHSPLRLPLGSEANSSPSASDAKDDEFDVSVESESSKKRRKHNDHSLDEDELTQPRSTRRSGRTRLPIKSPLAAPSFIPVRRLGQDGDNTVTLKRSEEKELAALTKVNTRKNKGTAVHPAQVLAKKAEEKDDPAARQRALKEVFDEKIQKKKETKKSKTVIWAEQLAQFQTDDKKVTAEEEADKEQPVVEEKKTAVKVGMRSKMSLGMAVNGTPAPKRKVRGRP